MADTALTLSAPHRKSVDTVVRSEADLAELHPTVREALIENKAEGLLLAVRARWVSLAIIGVVMPILYSDVAMFYYHAWLVVFALIGWAQLQVGRVGRSRLELGLIWLDLLCICIVITVPNPLRTDTWPTAYQYELSHFDYYYIFLAAGVLAYSWRTLAMFANSTIVIWLCGVAAVATFGSVDPTITAQLTTLFQDNPRILNSIDPNSVYWPDRIAELVVFVLVAGILAINGRRTTQLIYRQAEAARERANLARYFAPSIVNDMAARDTPLGEAREQIVTVMFVDIVGFTHQAETLTPQQTVDLLRTFHQELEAVIFNHRGTLDKFLGDGLMVTFGTPEPTANDAENALKCGLDILHAIEAWNVARSGQGQGPVTVSVGIHTGTVTIGDIGSERRMEYAVLGDTVNVASRLEAMTRELNVALIASDSSVQAAREQRPASAHTASGAISSKLSGSGSGTDQPSWLGRYQSSGSHSIRGRDRPINLWVVNQ